MPPGGVPVPGPVTIVSRASTAKTTLVATDGTGSPLIIVGDTVAVFVPVPPATAVRVMETLVAAPMASEPRLVHAKAPATVELGDGMALTK